MSAAYRIAILFALALSATIAVLGTALYVVADAAIRRTQDTTIAVESSDLVEEFVQDGPRALNDVIRAREAGQATNAFGYGLFDRTGRRVAGNFAAARPPAGLHDIVIQDPREGSDPYRVQATDLPGGMRLVVADDLDPVERLEHLVMALCITAFGLTVAIGVAGALLLGRYLRHRLERVGGTARAIAAGDMQCRVPVGRQGDEFDRLGAAFNAMLDRIGLLLENLRQVSSDVAHDLRTPLTRLRGELELALDVATSGPEHDAAVARALAESDGMLHLFAAILRLSEIESGRLAATFATVDIGALLVDLCESYAPAVADGGRLLHFAVQPPLFVRGDPELLAQAFVNLLDNAQLHTPAGTEIVVGAKGGVDGMRITVADTGPGVPHAEQARILDRFVRLEASRSTSGHGLGLNLVSAIAVLHGGKVTVGDNRPGLVVTIMLPPLR